MALLARTFEKRELRDPGMVRAIFGNTWLAPIWLFLRLYLGYHWLMAGAHKVWGGSRWIAVPGPDGLGLKAFWERAVAIPEQGNPPISFDWYRNFLTFMLDHSAYRWFAWVIAFGEVAVGIALIVGAFVGIAAFFGAFMNFNFLMAGSASINPVMFVVAMLVVFGWKTAGWIGLDRWLLPALGTPWQPGTAAQGLLKRRAVVNEACPECGRPVEVGRSPASA
jgi:thiosulfate dehydrogenase [quinone] large subunit